MCNPKEQDQRKPFRSLPSHITRYFNLLPRIEQNIASSSFRFLQAEHLTIIFWVGTKVDCWIVVAFFPLNSSLATAIIMRAITITTIDPRIRAISQGPINGTGHHQCILLLLFSVGFSIISFDYYHPFRCVSCYDFEVIVTLALIDVSCIFLTFPGFIYCFYILGRFSFWINEEGKHC